MTLVSFVKILTRTTIQTGIATTFVCLQLQFYRFYFFFYSLYLDIFQQLFEYSLLNIHHAKYLVGIFVHTRAIIWILKFIPGVDCKWSIERSVNYWTSVKFNKMIRRKENLISGDTYSICWLSSRLQRAISFSKSSHHGYSFLQTLGTLHNLYQSL